MIYLERDGSVAPILDQGGGSKKGFWTRNSVEAHGLSDHRATDRSNGRKAAVKHGPVGPLVKVAYDLKQKEHEFGDGFYEWAALSHSQLSDFLHKLVADRRDHAIRICKEWIHKDHSAPPCWLVKSDLIRGVVWCGAVCFTSFISSTLEMYFISVLECGPLSDFGRPE